MCVQVHISIWCTCMRVHACRGQRPALGVLPQELCTLSFESTGTWGLLAGQKASESDLCWPLQLWDEKHAPHAWLCIGRSCWSGTQSGPHACMVCAHQATFPVKPSNSTGTISLYDPIISIVDVCHLSLSCMCSWVSRLVPQLGRCK